MAKSQKPRKRASTFKHKQQLKLSKSLTKGSFAVNILSLGEHAVLNVLNGQIVKTPEQAKWLRKTYDSPCQWGFTYGCICRAPDGSEYISHFFKRFRTLHRLDEMDTEIGECLEEAVDDVNKEHILSPFYIASPEGREFTAEEVYELIALKNTFSRLSTKYEYRQAYKLGMEELKAINILDYLPPQDKALPAILAKNNLTTFYDVREKDKPGLLAIKGISEKRMATIEKAFADCTLKNLDRLKNFVQYVKIVEQFRNITQHLEKYIYTLVDDFGFESAPSLPSEPIYAHNDQAVVLSGLPTNFPTYSIAKVRLYCAVTPLDYGDPKAEYDAHFLLVDEIDFGAGSYVHQPHTVYGEECLTEEYEPPHECMTDLQYCGNGQIGGLVGTELWLSEPLKPHAFPEAYRYGRFNGKPIRFLCGERAGYILTDEYPAVIEMESPCQSKGCRAITQLEEPHPIISYQSACLYNGACFYATKDGIVMLAGNQSKVITTALYTQDQWQALAPWTMIGVVHDGYYFGFTETHSIRFKVPDSIHEEVQIETLTTLTIKPKAVYRSDQDELFFATDDGIYQWNAGDSWKRFKWQGRLNTLPGYTAMTAYKLVQDFAETQVKHTAYKRHRSELVREPVILGDKTVIDSRPHRLKAGYSTLQFDVEITGTGEVFEYHIATSVAELGVE